MFVDVSKVIINFICSHASFCFMTEITKSDLSPQCKIAEAICKNKMVWVNLFTILVWVLALAVIISLIYAIGIAIYRGDMFSSLVVFVGDVLGGTATAWVLKNRNLMQTELDQALKDVDKYCTPDKVIALNKFNKSLALFPGK